MLSRTRQTVATPRAVWLVGLATLAVVATEPKLQPVIKEWAVTDFDPVISVGLEGYRDFENGRRRFSDALCVECHRFAESGPLEANAPDLAKVAERYGPRELLEAILSPSAAIAIDDAVQVFELTDGRVVDGRAVAATESTFRISPDPRNPGQILTIIKSTIIHQRSSPRSAMPSGLLDTFEEEDVLDLLAYLLSRGNKSDPVFSR